MGVYSDRETKENRPVYPARGDLMKTYIQTDGVSLFKYNTQTLHVQNIWLHWGGARGVNVT